GGQKELRLANPIAADLSDMRPSLLPGLIAAAQANADRGSADTPLFEGGQIFCGGRPGEQVIATGGVRRALASSRGPGRDGRGTGRHWSGSAAVDAFDAKADALTVLTAAGASPQALQIAAAADAKNFPAWLHPGRSGAIQIGPQNVLGYFGELHPRALEAMG